MADLKRLYNENTSFKRYVDRYCNMYHFEVDEAIRHALVMSVAEYYMAEPQPRNEVASSL